MAVTNLNCCREGIQNRKIIRGMLTVLYETVILPVVCWCGTLRKEHRLMMIEIASKVLRLRGR
jgi:hypothetical protein